MSDHERDDAILERLTRAGVISHVVRFDGEPACLEQDAVGALLSLVGHSIFRIAPFVYGVGIARGEAEPSGDAVARELSAMLADAPVTVERCEAGPAADGAVPADCAIRLLRALPEGVEAAGEPGLHAVIDAAFAVRAAELTAERLLAAAETAAGASGQTLPDALGALARQVAALEAGLADPPDRPPLDLTGVEARIEAVERRLAALGACDGEQLRAVIDRLGGQVEALGSRPEAPPSADLAELEARIETSVRRLLARSGTDIAETRAAIDALAGALERGFADVLERVPSPEDAAPEGGALSGRFERLDEGLAAVSDALSGLSGGSDPAMGARLDDLAATLEGVLVRLPDQGVADGGAATRVEERLAALEDRLAAGMATEETLARLCKAVERVEARMAVHAPGSDCAGVTEALAGLGEDMRGRAEGLAGAVAAIEARLDALARTGADGEGPALERERMLRAGLAELAARLQLGGHIPPCPPAPDPRMP